MQWMLCVALLIAPSVALAWSCSDGGLTGRPDPGAAVVVDVTPLAVSARDGAGFPWGPRIQDPKYQDYQQVAWLKVVHVWRGREFADLHEEGATMAVYYAHESHFFEDPTAMHRLYLRYHRGEDKLFLSICSGSEEIGSGTPAPERPRLPWVVRGGYWVRA